MNRMLGTRRHHRLTHQQRRHGLAVSRAQRHMDGAGLVHLKLAVLVGSRGARLQGLGGVHPQDDPAHLIKRGGIVGFLGHRPAVAVRSRTRDGHRAATTGHRQGHHLIDVLVQTRHQRRPTRNLGRGVGGLIAHHVDGFHRNRSGNGSEKNKGKGSHDSPLITRERFDCDGGPAKRPDPRQIPPPEPASHRY